MGDLTVDEKVERLEQLSRLGEMRSVYAPQEEELETADEGQQLEYEVDVFEGDPTAHNMVLARVQGIPGHMPDRLMTVSEAVGEDGAVVQVPLHNCMVVYLVEGLQGALEPRERAKAADELLKLQMVYLDQWERLHGEMPTELLALLCDFSEQAPATQDKVAMWLLWASVRCTSAYWCEMLDQLPHVEELPHPVLCTEGELQQLQWPPMVEEAQQRCADLHTMFEALLQSGLPEKLGFRAAQPEDGSESDSEAPELTFERFAWAYLTANNRSFVYGDRYVFFPQLDPCLYTNDVLLVNVNMGLVTVEGLSNHMAVIAAMRDVAEGEVLHAFAPISGAGVGVDGASSNDLYWAFGMVPPGNDHDLIDLVPEVGSTLDSHLKSLMGQKANVFTGLAGLKEVVTEPQLRHLLDLVEGGKMPAEDLPPLDKMLPGLEMPVLYGPGLVAGLTRIRHVETAAPDWEAVMGVSEDERTKEQGASPETVVRQVPPDMSLWDTEEGRAQWRRTQAAYVSLPTVSADTKEYGRRMDMAVAGAPLKEVFPSPRDLERERESVAKLVENFSAVLADFPTTAERDEELLAAAVGAPPGSPNHMSATMIGVVSWRREFKLVWAEMIELLQDYQSALAKAA